MGTDLDTEDNQETIYQDLDLNGNPARKDIIIILAFDLYNQVNDTAISARMIQRYGLGYIYAQSAYSVGKRFLLFLQFIIFDEFMNGR